MREKMKVGDLVDVLFEGVGLVMAEPELSSDCLPGGDAFPFEHYYLVDILYPHGLIKSDYDDVLRVISESR